MGSAKLINKYNQKEINSNVDLDRLLIGGIMCVLLLFAFLLTLSCICFLQREKNNQQTFGKVSRQIWWAFLTLIMSVMEEKEAGFSQTLHKGRWSIYIYTGLFDKVNKVSCPSSTSELMNFFLWFWEPSRKGNEEKRQGEESRGSGLPKRVTTEVGGGGEHMCCIFKELS